MDSVTSEQLGDHLVVCAKEGNTSEENPSLQKRIVKVPKRFEDYVLELYFFVLYLFLFCGFFLKRDMWCVHTIVFQ